MSALHGRVDTTQFRVLLGRSSHLEPALKTSLRRRLRAVGQLSVKDIQTEVRKPPLRPSATPVHRGLRDRLAGSVKVTVMTGAKTGVTISAGQGLPADQKRLARLYDKRKGWRHPLFANRDAWYPETGRPYFASVVPRRRSEQIAAARQILADGAAALKG